MAMIAVRPLGMRTPAVWTYIAIARAGVAAELAVDRAIWSAGGGPLRCQA